MSMICFHVLFRPQVEPSPATNVTVCFQVSNSAVFIHNALFLIYMLKSLFWVCPPPESFYLFHIWIYLIYARFLSVKLLCIWHLCHLCVSSKWVSVITFHLFTWSCISGFALRCHMSSLIDIPLHHPPFQNWQALVQLTHETSGLIVDNSTLCFRILCQPALFIALLTGL